MKKNLKLAAVGLAAVAAGAIGVSSAYASGGTSPAPAATVQSGSNVQSGDQTTKDVAGAPAESKESTAPESAASTEKASTETAGTEKASAEADGPGGHTDTGNANSQFQGNQ